MFLHLHGDADKTQLCSARVNSAWSPAASWIEEMMWPAWTGRGHLDKELHPEDGQERIKLWGAFKMLLEIQLAFA